MNLNNKENNSKNFEANLFELPEGINLEGTALFTGHAKLPNGIALYEFLKVISCALIVELNTGKVLNASFTTLSPMTDNYISSLVIGWSFHEGMDELEKKFDRYCYISSKKAFLKAVEVAHGKYRDAMINNSF